MLLAHVGLDAAAKTDTAGALALTLPGGLVANGARGARTHGRALTRPLVAILVFAVAVKTFAVGYTRRAIWEVKRWFLHGRVYRWVDCWIDRRIRNGRVRAIVHGGVSASAIRTPVSGVRIIKVGPFTAAQDHTNCQQPDDSHPHRMNDASGSRQGDAKPLESLTERGIY